MGVAPPDDQAHAPNEWMDLDNYEKGIRSVARLWDEVARLGPEAVRKASN
jgi:acetylornithine deacetylase/succinyl-diaminopimelate desuccinylase-like protein